MQICVYGGVRASGVADGFRSRRVFVSVSGMLSSVWRVYRARGARAWHSRTSRARGSSITFVERFWIVAVSGTAAAATFAHAVSFASLFDMFMYSAS